MKVSVFGEFLRKLRIDKGMLLKEMADALGVTSSYLSAVEFGKRNIPKTWRNIIVDTYALSELQKKELDTAIQKSILEIKFDLKDKSLEDRDLIVSFARNLDSLDVKTKREIMEIFNQ